LAAADKSDHCGEGLLLNPVDISASVDQGVYHVEAFTCIAHRRITRARVDCVWIGSVLYKETHGFSPAQGTAPNDKELVARIPECSTVHLPHGTGQGREMTTVQSEKYGARCGSKGDKMRMITAR